MILSSDTDLQAIYTQQYKLNIVSSSSSSGDGWYHCKGSTARYSSNVFPQITNTLGITIFVGWYDENGNLVTISGTGSIVMDSPHTLNARWLRLDYSIPIAIIVLLIILLRRRHKGEENEQAKLEQVKGGGEMEGNKLSELARPTTPSPPSLKAQPEQLSQYTICPYRERKSTWQHKVPWMWVNRSLYGRRLNAVRLLLHRRRLSPPVRTRG